MRTAALLAGCLVGTLAAAQAPPTPRPAAGRVSQDDEAYLCPMHPDVITATPGICPRCRMTLVLGHPYDMRDYRVELRTTPGVITAGEKTHVQLTVFHPGTGAKVEAFTEVHLKRFHLFLVSQDMDVFEHVHPEQDDTGTWNIDLVLPKAGHYKLLADFVPFGGSPQFIAIPITTAGYQRDVLADRAHLHPDENPTKSAGDLTATVTYEPDRLVPANHSHLTFRLTHTGTNQPITDLQTYLGAFGHILIVSEDLEHFVHSHPIDMPAQDDKVETLLGGPQVVFEALMPTPGNYRAWVQFRYHDEVRTLPFTFTVQ
jgi:hypothetical protein